METCHRRRTKYNIEPENEHNMCSLTEAKSVVKKEKYREADYICNVKRIIATEAADKHLGNMSLTVRLQLMMP